MRTLVLLSVVCLMFALACNRGYKEAKGPESPEEIQIKELAYELSGKAEELQAQAPQQLFYAFRDFAESAGRFHNAAQRFRPNSLAARNAFDRLRYHANQLQEAIKKEEHPELFEKWQSLRADYVNKIGGLMRYKTEV